MSELLGIHSIYSFGERTRHQAPPYTEFWLFEFLTLVLSTQYWQLYNGPIRLVCDDNFYNFVEKYKLHWLWNEIDNTTLKNVPNLDYSIFWTYPKMYSHSQQTERFASVDADLFIRRSIKEYNEDFIYLHQEKDTLGSTYPDFQTLPEYKEVFKGLNPNLRYNAVNTAIAVFNNIDIAKELLEITDKFVNNTQYNTGNSYENYVYTIFTEQKVLGNLIQDKNYSSRSLMKTVWDCNNIELNNKQFFHEEVDALHLWGNKENYYKGVHNREDLNLYLISFLQNDFPHILDKIQPLFKKFIR